MKKGTVLKCIDARDDWYIKLGHLYVVVADNNNGVIVLVSSGKHLWYRNNRFKIIVTP